MYKDKVLEQSAPDRDPPVVGSVTRSKVIDRTMKRSKHYRSIMARRGALPPNMSQQHRNDDTTEEMYVRINDNEEEVAAQKVNHDPNRGVAAAAAAAAAAAVASFPGSVASISTSLSATEAASSSKWFDTKKSLGSNFTPGPFDVVCARGKQAWEHPGNRYLRYVANVFAQKYSEVGSRCRRSVIVTRIVEMIREKGHGFVKLDEETGVWVEAAELVAREKVGQCMRNILSSEFKSSFRNKKQRRKVVTANLTQKLHTIVMSDPFVSKAMHELEGNILKENSNKQTAANDISSPTSSLQQQGAGTMSSSTTMMATAESDKHIKKPIPSLLLRRKSSASSVVVGSNSADYINDKAISILFRQNNALLLEHFKKRPSLEQRFRKILVAYSTRQSEEDYGIDKSNNKKTEKEEEEEQEAGSQEQQEQQHRDKKNDDQDDDNDIEMEMLT